MNISDSERIAGFLEMAGLLPSENIKRANLVIFNTCGVRQAAENRAYTLIHNLKKNYPNKKIILTGCLADRKDVQRRLKNKVDLFLPIKDISKIQSAGWRTNLKIKNSEICDSSYLNIPPKHTDSFTAYVPIMTGCNNFCSYCVVPYARGREVSRPADEIIKEVRSLIKKGYKEIVLLGQNVNSYKDNKINFSKLLKKINAIPGDFWISFISSHPKDFSDKLVKTIAKSKKVCEWVHLPIQAGNDKILEKMNRRYTQSQYLKIIEKTKKAFKKYKPGVLFSLTSDIIVGFPSETKKQFIDSAKVMEKCRFDMVFFGQFSPRPGTAAWKLKDNVSKKEKAGREKFLNNILAKTIFENNKKYVGQTMEVLIDSKAKLREASGKNIYFGRTRTMKNVKITSDKDNLVGKIVKVKITKANVWNLEGICHSAGGRP